MAGGPYDAGGLRRGFRALRRSEKKSLARMASSPYDAGDLRRGFGALRRSEKRSLARIEMVYLRAEISRYSLNDDNSSADRSFRRLLSLNESLDSFLE